MERKFGFFRLSLSQLLWIIGGALLFAGGIVSLNSHSQNLVDTAFVLGIIMMLAGLCNVIIYCHKGKKIHGSHWLFADGLTTMHLAIFPVFNQMILPEMIPFFFGVWELFSGVLKVIDSAELKHEKIRCWQGFALIGFIELISGVASMIKPIDDLVGVNVVVAVILFVQCCGFFLKAYMYDDLIEKCKKNHH